MEMDALEAPLWNYRGEGAANIVLSYGGKSPDFVGKVLRIRKLFHPQVSQASAQSLSSECDVANLDSQLARVLKPEEGTKPKGDSRRDAELKNPRKSKNNNNGNIDSVAPVAGLESSESEESDDENSEKDEDGFDIDEHSIHTLHLHVTSTPSTGSESSSVFVNDSTVCCEVTQEGAVERTIGNHGQMVACVDEGSDSITLTNSGSTALHNEVHNSPSNIMRESTGVESNTCISHIVRHTAVHNVVCDNSISNTTIKFSQTYAQENTSCGVTVKGELDVTASNLLSHYVNSPGKLTHNLSMHRPVLSAEEQALWSDWPEIGQAKSSTELSYHYSELIIKPLLGSDYVDSGKIVHIDQHFFDVFSRNIDDKRPMWRKTNKKFEIAKGKALLFSDHSLFPFLDEKLQGKTICVELKPKCGFIPNCPSISPKNYIKKKFCRFFLHQHLKLVNGEVKEISKYDPTLLFSDSLEKIMQSIFQLFAFPQNNFRLFLDGNEIFGEKIEKHSKDLTETIGQKLTEIRRNVFPPDTMAFSDDNFRKTFFDDCISQLECSMGVEKLNHVNSIFASFLGNGDEFEGRNSNISIINNNNNSSSSNKNNSSSSNKNNSSSSSNKNNSSSSSNKNNSSSSSNSNNNKITLFVELVSRIIFETKIMHNLLAVQKLDNLDVEGIIFAYQNFLQSLTENSSCKSVSSSEVTKKNVSAGELSSAKISLPQKQFVTNEEGASASEAAINCSIENSGVLHNLDFHELENQKEVCGVGDEEKWKNEIEKIKQLSPEECKSILQKFLIAATAKDLGIMIALKNISHDHDFDLHGYHRHQNEIEKLTHLHPQIKIIDFCGHRFLYKISFVDLDLKPLKKIPKYLQMDQEIVDNFIKLYN